MQQQDTDYQLITRSKDQSIKYLLASSSIPEKPTDEQIVLSYADMQFKFPARLQNKLKAFNKINHLGYNVGTQHLWDVLRKWIHSRYYPDIQITKNTTLFWGNALLAMNGIIQATTQINDKICLFTPTYYKFIEDIRFSGRECVQFQLDLSGKSLLIDFEKLEEFLSENNIKLFIFMNPYNPCGRMWMYEELRKLTDLLVKYNVFMYSDQIFNDSVVDVERFTSILKFHNSLKDLLIYSSSYSKTMNCSGIPVSYTITTNSQVQTKLVDHHTAWSCRPTVMALSILQLSYSDPDYNEWRIKTSQYIKQNYELFIVLCKQKVPKLKIFDLQTSYLMLVDFGQYKLNFNQFREYFKQINVAPTFMDLTFTDKRATSLIRLNIACNREVIKILVDRLQKMVNIPWIQ